MKLKIYQIVLASLTITFCGFTAVRYGWQGYATITERPGVRGTMHFFYDQTIGQFATYKFIVVLLTLGMILFQAKYLFERNAKKLTQTYWFFGIIAIVVILSEIYLQTRYIPKG